MGEQKFQLEESKAKADLASELQVKAQTLESTNRHLAQ